MPVGVMLAAYAPEWAKKALIDEGGRRSYGCMMVGMLHVQPGVGVSWRLSYCVLVSYSCVIPEGDL